MFRRRKFAVISVTTLLLFSARILFAHAILVRSTPPDHAVVHNRNVQLRLDYNSRIDKSRSVVALTDNAGKNLPVRMRPSTIPSELNAVVNHLASGTYHIHWQVLASDGHITRGEVTFTVDVN